MSHLLEEYSKNLGVKISKPIVSKHFWPNLFDKYVTIYLDPQIPAKQYKHYSLVVDIIKKSLASRGIKIIQIGAANCEALPNVDSKLFNLEFKQFAYIISKSMLHIGVDNVYSHYANSINVPLVTIFGNVYKSIAEGYWNQNQIKMEAPWLVKPSLGLIDAHDSINKIKPEEIAKNIFRQLKIDDKIHMITRHIGEMYNHDILEIVPDFFSPMTEIQKHHVFLRPDYGMDRQSFVNWCNFLEKYSIFSQEQLEDNFCRHFEKKIKSISYIWNSKTPIEENHLEFLGNLGIGVSILVENQLELPLVRERYFDHNVQFYNKSSKQDLNIDQKDFLKLFFNSSKNILSQGVTYPSKYHFVNKIKVVDNSMNLLDNDLLLEELPHFYIYERTKS